MTAPEPAPDALATLRQVNHHLGSALLRFHPQRKNCLAIKPHDFSGLLNQLQRASNCLRGLASPGEMGAELEKECREYRTNLEKLKRFLPDVQVRLLAEKARLEAARSHLVAAEEWARSRQDVL